MLTRQVLFTLRSLPSSVLLRRNSLGHPSPQNANRPRESKAAAFLSEACHRQRSRPAPCATDAYRAPSPYRLVHCLALGTWHATLTQVPSSHLLSGQVPTALPGVSRVQRFRSPGLEGLTAPSEQEASVQETTGGVDNDGKILPSTRCPRRGTGDLVAINSFDAGSSLQDAAVTGSQGREQACSEAGSRPHKHGPSLQGDRVCLEPPRLVPWAQGSSGAGKSVLSQAWKAEKGGPGARMGRGGR